MKYRQNVLIVKLSGDRSADGTARRASAMCVGRGGLDLWPCDRQNGSVVAADRTYAGGDSRDRLAHAKRYRALQANWKCRYARQSRTNYAVTHRCGHSVRQGIKNVQCANRRMGKGCESSTLDRNSATTHRCHAVPGQRVSD